MNKSIDEMNITELIVYVQDINDELDRLQMQNEYLKTQLDSLEKSNALLLANNAELLSKIRHLNVEASLYKVTSDSSSNIHDVRCPQSDDCNQQKPEEKQGDKSKDSSSITFNLDKKKALKIIVGIWLLISFVSLFAPSNEIVQTIQNAFLELFKTFIQLFFV